MNKRPKYEEDFYAWTLHNAQLIRAGKFQELDNNNIAEELESMGRRDKRELMSRFIKLLAHLLKWKYQSERRGRSWQLTIIGQRDQIIQLLEDSPSLKYNLQEKLTLAYEKAIVFAEKETGLGPYEFPKRCPFTLEECLDQNFFPD
jgi:Domain of unknown function DUF29